MKSTLWNRLKTQIIDFFRAIKMEYFGRYYSPDSLPHHAQKNKRTSLKRGKHLLGQRGEELAAAYYQQRGATILERNFIVGGAEMDLILLDGGTLVFAEVKTRSGRNFDANPADAVDDNRKKRMCQAARAFRRWQRLEQLPIRFDIIAILWQAGEEPKLMHYPQAFRED